MSAETPDDWGQYKKLIISNIRQLKEDVHNLRTAQTDNTLQIFTEISALKTLIGSQKKAWWLVAGAVPSFLILLLSKFL